MQQTKTAITEHGSVEYEVTTCDSCGQEVAVHDIKDVIVAEKVNEYSNDSFSDYRKLKAHGEIQSAKICNYCANGEISGVSGSSGRMGSAKGIPRKIIALLITLALLPRNTIKEELENQGIEEFGAEMISTIVAVLWVLLLVHMSISLILILI